MDERHGAQDTVDRSATLAKVVSTLESLMQDWDVEEPIEAGTRVVADLGFESIDLIQMVGALERAFGLRGGALVSMLVADGRYVDDLTVGQIASSVDARLTRSTEA